VWGAGLGAYLADGAGLVMSPSLDIGGGAVGWEPRELVAAIEAFVQEHRRCGELEGGIIKARVRMSCECGAVLNRSIFDGSNPCGASGFLLLD